MILNTLIIYRLIYFYIRVEKHAAKHAKIQRNENKIKWCFLRVNVNNFLKVYIHAFSRHFYPKQLQSIYFLSVSVFPGN